MLKKAEIRIKILMIRGVKLMKTNKEMKQIYKEMKTPMGVFIIRNNINGKAFINASTDVKSTLNRFRFELKMGNHRIKEIQNDWKKYGEEAFDFEVLEVLKYDEKEEKSDYSEELEIMKIIWLEKLNENKTLQLYKK